MGQFFYLFVKNGCCDFVILYKVVTFWIVNRPNRPPVKFSFFFAVQFTIQMSLLFSAWQFFRCFCIGPIQKIQSIRTESVMFITYTKTNEILWRHSSGKNGGQRECNEHWTRLKYDLFCAFQLCIMADSKQYQLVVWERFRLGIFFSFFNCQFWKDVKICWVKHRR